MPNSAEGDTMLTIPGNTRIFICNYPLSMRKSFEGLSATVEELFPGELFSGSFFIFLNRQKNHMKVLFWDNDGFIILYKRLEKGTFSWKWNDITILDRRTFLMLLEGIHPKRLERRYSR